MSIIIHFLPILLFVILYVGTGIYFSLIGIANAFYQLSPTVAIMPAIALGWFLYRGTSHERMDAFLDGVRHRDIIIMCMIFLLAGAFSVVTKSIGSVDATVNTALSLIPSNFLLIGLFVMAAFISTAIGTSMGTIATIAPIAAGFAERGIFSMPLGMATVVSGAMFGDNLSLISDTTVAAVVSQRANARAKLRINAFIAMIAAIITLACLLMKQGIFTVIEQGEASFVLMIPYFFLIILALCGVNTLVVSMFSLVVASLTGYWHHGYSIFDFSRDISAGFASVQEIMILSMLVGGLSGLTGNGIKLLATRLINWIGHRGGIRMAQLLIAGVVSLLDLLLANNTIAIIFTGEMARDVSERYQIPPHYSAAWLDIFSCIVQGLIPYGAQLLLAGSIGKISPFSIVPHVYYCYALALVALGYIIFKPTPTSDV